MKVLLFSRDFYPSVGGVQTIVAELARGLADLREASSNAQSVDLTVITDTPGSAEVDRRFPFRLIRRPNFWAVVRLIRRTDIVHLAGPALAPLALSLLLGKPVVVEHHGFQAICPNGQLLYEPGESTCPGHFMAGNYGICFRCNRERAGLAGSARMLLLTPLRRWLCNRAHANITPTRWLASRLRLKHERTVLHGIQSSATAAGTSRCEPSASTFAYQGRLVSTKGIRVLLKAFEQLCDEGRSPRLIVVGAGPEEEAIRSASAPFAGRVQFLGEVPNDRLDQALGEAATIVMPSLAGEVFGLVAAENMMRGKLLIVSDLGSLREVVADAGLVFPVGDASALADCMRSAIDDAPRARRFAAAARARAEQVFSRERMVQEHMATYTGVLQQKRRIAPRLR
jgi:glycogen synthase